MTTFTLGNLDDLLNQEVEDIAGVVAARGPLDRGALAEAVRAHTWGPGRFSVALRPAVARQRVVSICLDVSVHPRNRIP